MTKWNSQKKFITRRLGIFLFAMSLFLKRCVEHIVFGSNCAKNEKSITLTVKVYVKHIFLGKKQNDSSTPFSTIFMVLNYLTKRNYFTGM